MADKLKDGWKYGQVKNDKNKEHPCLVPYDELPASQKAKDYIFKQTVAELAPYMYAEVQDEIGGEAPTKSDEATQTAPKFETGLAEGDEVMVATGGPKMKVDAVFNTELGVKAHCTWVADGKPSFDVFFERNLHKFEAVQEGVNEKPSEPNADLDENKTTAEA